MTIIIYNRSLFRDGLGVVQFNAFQQDMLLPQIYFLGSQDVPDDGISAYVQAQEGELRTTLRAFLEAPPELSEEVPPDRNTVAVGIPIPEQFLAMHSLDAAVKECLPQILDALELSMRCVRGLPHPGMFPGGACDPTHGLQRAAASS